jgi:hypothetical protein
MIDFILANQVAVVICIFCHSEGETVKETSTIGENVKTDLDLLPDFDILELLRFISHKHVANAPVKPREGSLDVEGRVLHIPILGVINFVDQFK